MSEPRFSIKYGGKQLDVYDTKLTITNVGVLQRMSYGSGAKSIQFKSLSSIQFKPAKWTPGYIQFTASGVSEKNGGLGDKMKDENTYVFQSDQNKVVEEIKDFIQDKLDNPQPSTSSQTVSVAEEIAKLAELYSQGILSESEFKDAKTRILNR